MNKKTFSLVTLLIFISLLTSCMGLQGPKRKVTLENKTNYTFDIKIKAPYFEDDDNPDTRTARLIPNQKVVYDVIGGFELEEIEKIPTNIDAYKVYWKPESDDDHWSISEKQKNKITVNNLLPVSVNLVNYYFVTADLNNDGIIDYVEAPRYTFPVAENQKTECEYYKNSLFDYWRLQEEVRTLSPNGLPLNTTHYVLDSITGKKYYYEISADSPVTNITIKLLYTINN